jgi:hypothetical protein
MPFKLDPNLKPYATPSQWAKLEALQEHGTERAAAEALKIDKGNFSQAKKAVFTKAARQGYAPDHDMIHAVPEGFMVKGTSTLYDSVTGEPKIQWVKTQVDRERQLEFLKEAVAALSEDIPRARPVPAPNKSLKSLCNLYTITDFHMGMLAWHREGGADWDIKIAEKVLNGCFAAMVAGAPAAEHCVIAQLGDFLHSDGLSSITPMSGHVLDQDGRFPKIVNATIGALRNVVDMALVRHKTVHVIMAEGNHDMASSVWLRQMFAVLYENEPRVTVDQSPLPYYVRRHGKTMLAFHHGHLKKPDALPMMFAAQFPAEWGATTHRYGHSGHQHHVYTKEGHGMTVTQHPTLAARDAYASRGGWHSDRQALCITYHDKYGQVASNHVTPEMLES